MPQQALGIVSSQPFDEDELLVDELAVVSSQPFDEDEPSGTETSGRLLERHLDVARRSPPPVPAMGPPGELEAQQAGALAPTRNRVTGSVQVEPPRVPPAPVAPMRPVPSHVTLFEPGRPAAEPRGGRPPPPVPLAIASATPAEPIRKDAGIAGGRTYAPADVAMAASGAYGPPVAEPIREIWTNYGKVPIPEEPIFATGLKQIGRGAAALARLPAPAVVGGGTLEPVVGQEGEPTQGALTRDAVSDIIEGTFTTMLP